MQTPPDSPKSNMSERQSSAASENPHSRAGTPAAVQRPASSQAQRRTPQKLGPRKHSHQSQPGQSSTQTPKSHETEHSGRESTDSRPPIVSKESSLHNSKNQQGQLPFEQPQNEGGNQSRRRQSRRRGRGRSKTQTSDSETGSVSEVAQGGRRNRNRKNSAQPPLVGTQNAQDQPTNSGASLDTLDEDAENANEAVETATSTTGGVRKKVEGKIEGGTTTQKKGKGKEGEREAGKESTLRLRIDLDLDVELELKAKIQGAVTLALLD